MREHSLCCYIPIYKKGITVISALFPIVLFCKKSVKIRFILNKVAFYLVVSKIVLIFAPLIKAITIKTKTI